VSHEFERHDARYSYRQSVVTKQPKIGFTCAVEAKRIARRLAGPLGHFLFGAPCETEDHTAAHRQAVIELGRVIDGLAR
jgi:hypothetical protein